MLPKIYDEINQIIYKITDIAHHDGNGHLLPVVEELRQIRDDIPDDNVLSQAYDKIMRAIELPDFKKWVEEKDSLFSEYVSYIQHNEEPSGFKIWAVGRWLDIRDEIEVIEHLEEWGWNVTTNDVCRKCRKKFKVEDRGNIKGYKPWIHGDFWHKNCFPKCIGLDNLIEKGKEELDKSIEKWEKIVNSMGVDASSSNCELCKNHYQNDCENCPVFLKTGKRFCKGTPYIEWVIHHEEIHNNYSNLSRQIFCVECKKLAQDELDFLKSLRS